MSFQNEEQLVENAASPLFSRDLAPEYMRMVLLLHGVDLPRRKKNEPLRYLELGCGRGLALNVHAAAVPGDFWGVDNNPDYALKAGELAQAAGLDTHTLNLSFAELDEKSAAGELPQFDIIAFSDGWSRINEEQRLRILSLIKRNLKTGGVFYVSYHTLPGWAPFMPARDLMGMYGELMGSAAKDEISRLRESYAFALGLAKAGAGYFADNPSITSWLEALNGQPFSRATLDHMKSRWRPYYFSDVASDLGQAKCSFVSSARLLTQLEICLPPEAVPILRGAANPSIRETLRDYCLNQRYRADLFVKGSRQLNQREHVERMSDLCLALTCQLEAVSLEIMGPRAPMSMKEEIYRPVLAALADNNYAPKTLENLEDHPLLEKMDSIVLVEALTVLAGAGYVHPAREKAGSEAEESCARLNRELCKRAASADEVAVLASPVLGGGVGCSRLEKLFMLSHAEGGQNAKDFAEDAWKIIAGNGEEFMRDGKKLEPGEALAALVELAEVFAAQRLPYLKAMGVSPSGVEPS